MSEVFLFSDWHGHLCPEAAEAWEQACMAQAGLRNCRTVQFGPTMVACLDDGELLLLRSLLEGRFVLMVLDSEDWTPGGCA